MNKKMKNILIIDDSTLMRRCMSDIIHTDNRLHVEEVARNGLEGIELLKQGKRFDLIVLDINMPKMDGVAFLEEMVRLRIKMVVLLVSSIASRNTRETIRALELGAFDFIRKPDGYIGTGNVEFKEQLLSKILLAVDMKKELEQDIDWNKIAEIAKPKTEIRTQRVLPSRLSSSKEKLVFIASSTGGPKSLQEVIPLFPKNFPYPVIIVQHMPEGFTKSLAERLNDASELTVMEMEDKTPLKKGHVYIAKGGSQAYLVQENKFNYSFAVRKDPPRNALRPCADILIESLAETSFDHIVCAVLTGMGADGTAGIAYLKQYKNVSVVAQDEASSIVYGMPRAVKMAGLVDEVVSLSEITNAIIKKAGE